MFVMLVQNFNVIFILFALMKQFLQIKNPVKYDAGFSKKNCRYL